MIPSEFKMPEFTLANALGKGAWTPTAFNGVQKAVAGSVGSMYAEFRVHEEYSGADSILQDREVKRPVEICLIKTDRFSVVPLRVGKLPTAEDRRMIRSEMTRQQEIDLSPLYERFRSQRESTDTSIFTWEAVNDMERGHLGGLGVFTVEQLHNTPKEQRYRFGPAGEELWTRADRFIRTKKENDPDEKKKELELLRAEREANGRRIEELERKYLELQEMKMRGAPVSRHRSAVTPITDDEGKSLSDLALENATKNLKGLGES